MRGDLPEFRDSSIAAVWLLKGVVYADDERVWNILLSNVSWLEGYFARLGLRLVVDESEGMAYLRQLTDEEAPDGYDALPKLFRTTRLSYGQTLLCVLLRDELRRFEEEDLRNERCVMEETALFDQWKAFFPSEADEVKQQKEMLAALRKLEDLGLVRRFSDEPPCWEIRRILKARLPAAELESLREQLATSVHKRALAGVDQLT
jgi:Domain of unknown function (DUF4194)